MKFLDWIIILVFLTTLTTIGFLFSKRNKDIKDYFLGGRSMPTWLVAMAAVGTSISAGTFVGAPQISFDENMTYLMLSVGAILGGIMAAYLVLPTLYKAGTITIYGYLDNRFGSGARNSSSIMFLLGQLLTSGSRLFIAAIAVSVMLFNDILLPNLIISIIILGVISTIYTVAGGIKGLIYIDTFQTFLIIVSGLAAIYIIYNAIPSSFTEIYSGLRHSIDADTGIEKNKLLLIDNSFTFDRPYNLIGALIGCTIFKFAQYTTDQEFVQRQLTTKSAKKGSISLIYSQIISLPIVLIFMVIGLLLYVYYQMPQLMGDTSNINSLSDSRQVFPQFIFDKVPSGALGFMMVGLLAAALSSFNSAINGMTSSLVSDIYIPLKKKRNKLVEKRMDSIKESKVLSFIMGMVLTAFAILTALLQNSGGQSLVDFALGIMSFSYAGMLGVFMCAVFTRRGNVKSVIWALVTGFIIVILLQPQILGNLSNYLFGFEMIISWPWWVTFGGIFSFFVCCLGKNQKKR